MGVRRPLVAVLVLSLPFAAACGAGKGNATSTERSTPYVASADAGSMAVRGIRVVPDSTGDSAGYLIASVVNRGTSADTLTNATVAGGAVTPSGVSGFTIDPTHLLQFSTPDAGGSDAATLQILALSTPLTVGTTVPVTFTFDKAGTVRVDAPVKSPAQVGSTATAAPIETTGSYPTPSESAEPDATTESTEP